MNSFHISDFVILERILFMLARECSYHLRGRILVAS